jgi:hypothetical protein
MALTASLGAPASWPGYPANEVIASVGRAAACRLADGRLGCGVLPARNASGVMTTATAITATATPASAARLRLISLLPSRMV